MTVTDSSLVDDGIQRSGSRSSDNSRGGGLGFSTSVPIDVPAWMGSSMNQATFNYHDDDDDVNKLILYDCLNLVRYHCNLYDSC